MRRKCMLVIVHGGAGERRPTKNVLKTLAGSLAQGYEILEHGGTALDAVVRAITVLEDSGTCNAGTGGNLQLDGIRRLDASVMEGKELKTGSVIGVEGVRNPIKLARLIMDLPNTMLTNVGAKRIAKANNLDPLPGPDRRALEKLEQIKNRAGGTLRLFKRYFSTVGAGVYAENAQGAVSCTGVGEYIVRLSLAKEICMNLGSMPPRAASSLSLKRLVRTGGTAGVIVLDNRGRFSIVHSTRFMAAGYADKKGIIVKEGF
jgi:beta-aspartyl-peptidase (threonine type)